MSEPVDIPKTSVPDTQAPVGDFSSTESSARSALEKKSREKFPKGSLVLERPGREAETWERWLIAPDHTPELLAAGASIPQRVERVVALPSATLFSWPLWVAEGVENLELVRMELSGRHLLKRGMEESLAIIPILGNGDRQLLLAVAPEEPFPGEVMLPGWQNASRFELPARLLAGSSSHDLILWEEWGVIQMAFYRNQSPVWFCSVRQQGLVGLIQRTSLRLLAEGVLERLPARILLEGFPGKEHPAWTSALKALFPGSSLSSTRTEEEGEGLTPPLLPLSPADIPPAEAQAARRRSDQQKKLFSFAVAGAVLYLLLLLWGAGDLLLHQNTIKSLRAEIARIQQPALNAQEQSAHWRQFRPVIDPSTYALDLLAAAAAPTDGGKVRLTLFSLEPGHLHLAGEASDVTQAYSVIEQLKKNPLLQGYDWSSGQPQLAGKNSVKFDMEGTRPDAPQQTATP